MIVSTDETSWTQSLDWGTELAEDHFGPGAPGSWDARATAGILAVAGFALAHRHQATEVRELGAERLICPLFSQTRFTSLVHDTISGPRGLEAGEPADRVVAMWTWLTRRWPVDELRTPLDTTVEYPPPSSIGGRCVPRPAVEVYLGWAGRAVDRVLRQERGAVTGNHIHITGGEHAGRRGRLENPVWQLTPELDRVVPGPPPAYIVTVRPTPADDALQVEILSEHIEVTQ